VRHAAADHAWPTVRVANLRVLCETRYIPSGRVAAMEDLFDAPTRAELVWTLLGIAAVAVVAHFALPLVGA
jgi:hypothetical protein